jgi:hypothetical protein
MWASAQCIFLNCLWPQHVVPSCLQWLLGLLFPLALAGNRGQCSIYLSQLSMGTACSAVMFAVATDTTISCTLYRQYGPVLSLSSLDVYGYSMCHLNICSGHWNNYFLQPGQAEEASALSIFLKCLWVQHVSPLCLQWLLAQLFPPAWTGSTGQCSIYLSSVYDNIFNLMQQVVSFGNY